MEYVGFSQQVGFTAAIAVEEDCDRCTVASWNMPCLAFHAADTSDSQHLKR